MLSYSQRLGLQWIGTIFPKSVPIATTGTKQDRRWDQGSESGKDAWLRLVSCSWSLVDCGDQRVAVGHQSRLTRELQPKSHDRSWRRESLSQRVIVNLADAESCGVVSGQLRLEIRAGQSRLKTTTMRSRRVVGLEGWNSSRVQVQPFRSKLTKNKIK